MAARDHSAADPGAERQHHEVVDAASGTRAPFGDRSRVRVVVEADRQAEAVLHQRAERAIDERDVHAFDDDTRRLVDRRRDAEADRPDLVVEQCHDRRLELCEHRFLRVLRVGRSRRRTISPERVTTPARIFVPPTSTPMA